MLARSLCNEQSLGSHSLGRPCFLTPSITRGGRKPKRQSSVGALPPADGFMLLFGGIVIPLVP